MASSFVFVFGLDFVFRAENCYFFGLKFKKRTPEREVERKLNF